MKRLFCLLLAMTMIFSFTAVPAAAESDFTFDGAAVAAYADEIFSKDGNNWTHDCVKYARMCLAYVGVSVATGGNYKMSKGLVDSGYADKYELYVTKEGRVPVKENEGKIGLGDLIENYCPGKNCSRGYYHANIVVGTTTINGVDYWVVNSHSKSGTAIRYHESNIAGGKSGKNYKLTTCCGSRVVLYCFHFKNNTAKTPSSGSVGSSLPKDTNVTSASPKTENGVENTTINLSISKSGKIKLTWTKSAGYKVDYYQVFRSLKKNSGYGKTAYYTTSSGSNKVFTNTSNIVKGTTYYYKVRGVRKLKGKDGGTVKIYTKWSNKVSRTAGTASNTASGTASNNTSKYTLTADGKWGKSTTRTTQHVLGIKEDGVLGPATIKAIQKKVGVKADGKWGSGTTRAMQKFLGVTADGIKGPNTIKAWQKWCNKQL